MFEKNIEVIRKSIFGPNMNSDFGPKVQKLPLMRSTRQALAGRTDNEASNLISLAVLESNISFAGVQDPDASKGTMPQMNPRSYFISKR